MLKTKKTRSSKNNQIADQLRNDIRFGIFRDGERLKEEYLSVRYHASRNPVREALQILKAEGFIEISISSGIEVKSVSITEIYEGLELFETVFTRVLKASVKTLTEEDCQQIDVLSDQIAACSDLMEFDRLVLIIKSTILHAPDLKLFPFIIGILYKKLGAFVMFLFQKKMSGAYETNDFRQFTRLVRERNFDAACQGLEQHLSRYIHEMKFYASDPMPRTTPEISLLEAP